MTAHVHTDRDYEAELVDLRERLLRMAGRVEEMIAHALVSLRESDVTLAERTIAIDHEVNADEVEIDELCLSILARRQPMASDLRFIALALKMVTDLERIGDLAVNLCERSIALAHQPPLAGWRGSEEIGRKVQLLIRDALDALVARDADAARSVIARDDEIDDLYHRTLRELFEMMGRDPGLIQRGVLAQEVTKLLERIGDHATNLAEAVVFFVDATDIRHPGKRTRRRT